MLICIHRWDFWDVICLRPSLKSWTNVTNPLLLVRIPPRFWLALLFRKRSAWTLSTWRLWLFLGNSNQQNSAQLVNHYVVADSVHSATDLFSFNSAVSIPSLCFIFGDSLNRRYALSVIPVGAGWKWENERELVIASLRLVLDSSPPPSFFFIWVLQVFPVTRW